MPREDDERMFKISNLLRGKWRGRKRENEGMRGGRQEIKESPFLGSSRRLSTN